MRMSPSIGQLFNKDRLNGNTVQLLLLIFYAPLGLVLVLLRCFVSLQLIIAVAVLPQHCLLARLVVRALCCTLGLVVRQHSSQNKSLSRTVQQLSSNQQLPSGRRRLVLLSNHISVFDHLVLSLLVPCIKVEGNGEGIPRLVSSLLGCLVLTAGPGDRSSASRADSWLPTLQSFVGSESRADTAGQDSVNTATRKDSNAMADGDAVTQVRQRTSALTSSSDNSSTSPPTSIDSTMTQGFSSLNGHEFENYPLLLFPENSTTSGTVALLKYEKWAARVSSSMALPVAISARRVPPLPLALAVAPPSSFLQEIFSLFFCPLTVYTVTCVGETSQQAGETEDSFCRRLQSATAEALGLQASVYSVQDKEEYLQALAAEQRRVAASHATLSPHRREEGGRGSTELRQMVTQVHEVLPDVPVAAIWRDLVRSGNVDVTITNFLEGAVPDYTPPPATSPPSTAPSMASGSDQPSTSAPVSPPTSLLGAPSPSPPGLPCSSINLSTKADSFPRSACERMLSFNQRKALLLENALKKYIENFGVNGERDPYLKYS